MLQFFAQRGISAEVLERNGVCAELAYNPATKREERVIAFPYFRCAPPPGPLLLLLLLLLLPGAAPPAPVPALSCPGALQPPGRWRTPAHLHTCTHLHRTRPHPPAPARPRPCRQGQVANVKYRQLPKQFWSRPGGQKMLYGYDDVWPGPSPEAEPILSAETGLPLNDTIVFVEGEMDKLALNQAGLWSVVSVPFGAPSKASAKQPAFEDFDPLRDKNFSYVWDCRELFGAGCRRVVIATDNDGPGYALREELARRLGR